MYPKNYFFFSIVLLATTNVNQKNKNNPVVTQLVNSNTTKVNFINAKVGLKISCTYFYPLDLSQRKE